MSAIDINELARQLAVSEQTMETRQAQYESGLARMMEYIAQRETEGSRRA